MTSLIAVVIGIVIGIAIAAIGNLGSGMTVTPSEDAVANIAERSQGRLVGRLSTSSSGCSAGSSGWPRSASSACSATRSPATATGSTRRWSR